MNKSTECTRPSFRRPALVQWSFVVAIAIAAVLGYLGSLDAPFVFDDGPAILENPSIRQLWPLRVPLSAPAGATGADGRPLVNLSLALNYAFGGLDPQVYHATNLVLHGCAALLLFGLVRRTLALPTMPAHLGAHSTILAGAISLLWTVHPLLSESVICVVQRNELLVAIFYLLTLYGLIRSTTSPHPPRWLILSVTACFLGVPSKEVIVSAPLVALFFDRAFLSGTFGAAWRARWRYYLALAGSWILLFLLVSGANRRAGTAGFGLGVSPWEYLLTQCHAIVLYLKLAFWPSPLVLDYGDGLVHRVRDVWLQACLLVSLAGATIWALRRHPRIGWIGFCFFAILSPSSSVVPLVTQTMAEHRMYLPLAVVIVAVLVGLAAWRGQRGVVLTFALVPPLLVLTIRRNADYRSELSIWADTAAKCPTNPRALDLLGSAAVRVPGHLDEAIAAFRAAVRVRPNYEKALNNLANTLMMAGPSHYPEAIALYEQALQLHPDYPAAHANLGYLLSQLPGRTRESFDHLYTALRLRPDYPGVYFNLGLAYAANNDLSRALECFDAALRQQPGMVEAHYRRANVLLVLPNRRPDAIAAYEETLRLSPDYPEAHHNLGIALMDVPGRQQEAIRHLERAAALRPTFFSAFFNLGLIYANMPGQQEKARTNLERALTLRPESEAARQALTQLDDANR